METHTEEAQERGHGQGPKPFNILVNKQSVTFERHNATGLEIKQAAIAQGVQIEPDFSLFEIHGNGHLKQIGDEETVGLHDGQEFRATAPDDNS